MQNRWISNHRNLSIDGYAEWNTGDGSPYYPILPRIIDSWLHVLIRLGSDFSPTDLLSHRATKGKIRFQPYVLNPPAGARDLGIVPALASVDLILELRESDVLQDLMPEVALGLPHGNPPDYGDNTCPIVSVPDAKVLEKNKYSEWPNTTVLMGIIDDGIAFGHRRFRTSNLKTRVEFAWVQGGDCRLPGGQLRYGREFMKDGLAVNGGIDIILRDSSANKMLEEDEFYRAIGLADFGKFGHKSSAWRVAHGTHILDLAAGEEPELGLLNRPIISVELPTFATSDTSGASFEPNVLDGVLYILDRADKLVADCQPAHLPIVINFSFGMYASAHRGSSLFEEALDKIIESRREQTGQPFEIIVPAGNGHLAQCHSEIRFDEFDQCKDLTWRLVPDDRTSSFMEIWLPPLTKVPDHDRVQLQVKPPSGPTSSFLLEKHGSGYKWEFGPKSKGLGVCSISYEFFGPPLNQGRFLIATAPTRYDTDNPLAPSGDWTITLKNGPREVGLCPDEIIEAWIQRDDTPFGYLQRGRQSYFIDALDDPFDPVSGRPIETDNPDAKLRRGGMMNAIGTGSKTVVIGGLYGTELIPTRYTAGGPDPQIDSNWPRNGPDALVVSDDSHVHQGVLGAGSRDGSVVSQSGTSVAAPQVARWLADQMHQLPPYTDGRNEILQKATMDEARMPDHAPEPPMSNRGGAGRLTSLLRRSRGIEK